MHDREFQHNFHTHTFRCKHAEGDVADYCDAAVARGMKTLGISDHSALPGDPWTESRMTCEELPGYVAAIDRAREDYPQLRVVKGMECEYLPEHHSWYEDELFGNHNFEYLIGAAHVFLDDNERWVGTYGGTNSPKALGEFADYTVRMMASGLFTYIAHPDLFGNCYETWDEHSIACTRAIMAAAQDLGVALEVNALGLRKQAYKKDDNPYPLYPWLPFWELAGDYDIEVIVAADAHRPIDVQARTGEAFAIVDDLGLKHVDVNRIGVK